MPKYDEPIPYVKECYECGHSKVGPATVEECPECEDGNLYIMEPADTFDPQEWGTTDD